MDIIFLSFANSEQDRLPTLSREAEYVFNALVNRQLKGHFLIHREEYTTLEKINRYLATYCGRLAVFLYSGHAGRDALQLGEEAANARGIAWQLGESARRGKLKLVVLNGCSTLGQVKTLLEQGVPAVIATHAMVGDRSATEFSIRLFNGLSEKRLSIRQAFEEALGAAQTVTAHQLDVMEHDARGFSLQEEKEPQPLWGLFYNQPEALDTNPLPQAASKGKNADFVPNEQLTQALFETLLQSGCREARNLQEEEDEGGYVEIGDKQTAIVNVLPYPLAIHLQKLLCPIEQENEGYDKISLRRLEQVGQAYHTAMEFLAFVMLAQLWELRLDDIAGEMPRELAEQLRSYFHLGARERAVFDYLPLIRSIWRFFDSLWEEKGIEYFISELEELKTLSREGGQLANACAYLANLRRQSLLKNISENDVPDMCEEAEEKLCAFVSVLGFLHRYTLTSVQNIDIRKYRHQLTAQYNHAIVKLMRAFGKPEHNYYLLSSFLDNRGVVLLKGKVKVVNARRKQFVGEDLEFLNLSPFVIDRNAFEDNTDLSNLLFFEQYRPVDNIYVFKRAKLPDSARDRLEAPSEGAFEAVHQQLEAFRTFILNESPQTA